MIEQPDLNWYLKKSQEHAVPPRCPYAAANRCPRYYQSLSLLGKAGSTAIQTEEDNRLFKKWRESELWPLTAEYATGIAGPKGEHRHFINFCPEISFDRFGYFASALHRYTSESDMAMAHRQLRDTGVAITDWRWSWLHLTPVHYTECYLYSLLHANKSGELTVSRPAISDVAPSVLLSQGNSSESLVGQSFKYDVFICHASEDKDSIVRSLAEELSSIGFNVWYDEFTLKVGDSLRRSIEKGLIDSRHGVVIISPDFFKKEWPQKELDGLNALEDGVRKVILPIWHKVIKTDVLRYSPILADRVAINSSSGIKQVVSELLKVIRPKDKYEKLLEAAISKWVSHDIFPSVEELYILSENINPEQLTCEQVAFLYCAFLVRDDEMFEWKEKKEPSFSFHYLKDHLFKLTNFDKDIFSNFHITANKAGMLGKEFLAMHGTASMEELELSDMVLSFVILHDDQGESPAIYLCLKDLKDKGLEILLVRSSAIRCFVRYMPKHSNERMRQIQHHIIDLN